MSYKRSKKGFWTNKHLRYIIAIMAACSIVYHLPAIGESLGWTSLYNTFNGLHDFYGIDFLGLVFFVPVVYAAYVLGVTPAIVVALVAMFVLLPRAIMDEQFPNAMFKPTAFVIILSAV